MDSEDSELGYLDQAEKERLDKLAETNPFVADVRSEVGRILASQTFRRVRDNARDLLRFLVDWKLLGNERRIKEKTIAIRVFHESADYKPADANGKVRVAIGNLRRKLARYYAGEGKTDPIEITIPSGRYVPDLADRRISISVSRFENWNRGGKDGHLLSVIRGELVRELAQAGLARVQAIQNSNTPSWPFRYVVRGSLETIDDKTVDGILRLNVSVGDLLESRIAAAQTFECRREDFGKILRRVAAVIVSALMHAAKKVEPVRLRRIPARDVACHSRRLHRRA